MKAFEMDKNLSSKAAESPQPIRASLGTGAVVTRTPLELRASIKIKSSVLDLKTAKHFDMVTVKVKYFLFTDVIK